MSEKPTQKRLKELFNYDINNGNLIRKICKGDTHIGDIAGCLSVVDGYHYIGVDGKLYKRSRLVFCWHSGYFPELSVDHINRIKNDDRIGNLREVSQQCNSRNCGNFSNNTSGVKGVCFNNQRKKWIAFITVNKEKYYLGIYKSFDNAVCARLAAEQCLNWEGCDSNSPAYQYVQKTLRRTI